MAASDQDEHTLSRVAEGGVSYNRFHKCRDVLAQRAQRC